MSGPKLGLQRAQVAARHHVVLGALARLGGWQPPWKIAKEAGYTTPTTTGALRVLRERRRVLRRDHGRDHQGHTAREYRAA